MRKIRTMASLFLLGAVAFVAYHAGASEEGLKILNTGGLRVGDVALIQVISSNPGKLFLKKTGKEIPVFNYKGRKLALLAIPGREAPGSRAIELRTGEGEVFTKNIPVSTRRSQLVTLPVPAQLKQTPQQLVANLSAQKSELLSKETKNYPEPLFTHFFGLPLSDNRSVTGRYGEIRKSGDESIRHLGTDFGGAIGSSVYAINDGIVSKAYLDPIYGNTVIIDHGARITSLYMHMNSISVTEGERVKQGKRVGTLGKTGYASGPHLHLSIKIDGESIDPLQFIKTFK